MNFDFNGHYLQIGGTVMGTSVTPNCANLFMDRFHLKALVWKRIIMSHGDTFVEYLNSLHESIKFIHESSYTDINFRETTAKFNDNREVIITLICICINTVQHSRAWNLKRDLIDNI